MADMIDFSQSPALCLSFLVLALQVIICDTSQLCGDIGNSSVIVNCTDVSFVTSTSSSSVSSTDTTTNQVITQAALSENKTVILSLQTTTVTLETMAMVLNEDVLRFSLIGLVIVLGILGVVVLIVIRRKSSIRYNNEKTRRQSLVRSSTDPDFIIRKYHPYFAALKNIPNGTVFYTKSASISEQGMYSDQV
ncbi:uncharacterized protein LOC144437702 [Glandiceps talaboti]